MDPDVSTLISAAQAIEILDAAPVVPREIVLPLDEAAGFVLANDIVADRDDPPFDKSVMDGFALRSADAGGDRFTLKVVGEIAAGDWPSRTIQPGECAAIYTGAPLPNGTDTVIPVEFLIERSHVAYRGDTVTFAGPVPAGRYIARRGTDCRAEEILLSRGTLLSPAAIAVAASAGAAKVRVFSKPRVAILSSGNEIVSADQMPERGQIRNSNGPMLIALLSQLGCITSDRGSVIDDPQLIRAAIETSLGDHDAVFITGGMSMGELDFVPRVLREMDVDLKITKLKIKPGKPFVFGMIEIDGAVKYIFGLPGNPVSGFVCTMRFASRIVRRLAGKSPEVSAAWISGPINVALAANGPREFYQPAVLQSDGSITPLTWRGSADIYTLARANVLILRAENEGACAVGQILRAMRVS